MYNVSVEVYYPETGFKTKGYSGASGIDLTRTDGYLRIGSPTWEVFIPRDDITEIQMIFVPAVEPNVDVEDALVDA
jgi:hypothetical protein